MTKRNCQNCEQEIGHLEESYVYYGRTICKACMIRLEKQFQDLETTNRNNKDEIQIKDVLIKQIGITESAPEKEEMGDKQLNSLSIKPDVTRKETQGVYEEAKEPDTTDAKVEGPEQSDYSSSGPAFFSYEGRINRAKYLLIMLLTSFLGFLVISIWATISPESSFVGNILLAIFTSFPVVKRWHDIDKSGANYFWFLVPIANLVAGIILLFSKGTVGSNQYGPDPLKNTENNHESNTGGS